MNLAEREITYAASINQVISTVVIMKVRKSYVITRDMVKIKYENLKNLEKQMGLVLLRKKKEKKKKKKKKAYPHAELQFQWVRDLLLLQFFLKELLFISVLYSGK